MIEVSVSIEAIAWPDSRLKVSIRPGKPDIATIAELSAVKAGRAYMLLRSPKIFGWPVARSQHQIIPH